MISVVKEAARNFSMLTVNCSQFIEFHWDEEWGHMLILAAAYYQDSWVCIDNWCKCNIIDHGRCVWDEFIGLRDAVPIKLYNNIIVAVTDYVCIDTIIQPHHMLGREGWAGIQNVQTN